MTGYCEKCGNQVCTCDSTTPYPEAEALVEKLAGILEIIYAALGNIDFTSDARHIIDALCPWIVSQMAAKDAEIAKLKSAIDLVAEHIKPDMFKELRDEIIAKDARIAELEKALTFYAQAKHFRAHSFVNESTRSVRYDILDQGDIAKTALINTQEASNE